MTSHDVVAVVRRRWRTRAVGHTGTLDPFATGLLVLVLGPATRLARFVERGTKTYAATVALGQRTTTDDPTGDPVGDPWAGPWPDRPAVEAALAALTGVQAQRPPAFSAKHVGGERSHRLAREGVLLELPPVTVDVASLELARYEPPVVELRAVVGPGTYVRAIARDLGQRLGTGGHLTALRRERVGRFAVSQATPVGGLTGEEPLVPPLELVGDLQRVALDGDQVRAVRHGRAVDGTPAAAGLAALVADGELISVAEARNGRWQPIVVLAAA